MKCLTIVCIGALLTLSAASDAFGWGAVAGPRGGAAYRGPMGGAAVRTPSGAAAVRGPYGGAAARGPYGGTAYRPPAYGGGTVYRNTTVVAPGYGYGAAAVRRSAPRREWRLVPRRVRQRLQAIHPATTRPITAIRPPTTRHRPGSGSSPFCPAGRGQ